MVDLTVEQGNRAPVLETILDQSTDENVELTFGASATDPDGTVPALTMAGTPTGAVFTDNADGTAGFAWTPTFDQAGVYPVSVVASDGELADTASFTITVINVNRAPELAAIGSQMVNEGEALEFTVTATDPDGTTPAFSAEGLPTGAGFTDNDDGTASFAWTPDNSQSGVYDVWFITTDGVLADSELVTIQVIDMDGFVATPNVLTFSAVAEGPNPDLQSFNLAVSDGSVVGFNLEETADWFALGTVSGVTPVDVDVTVDITGLAAGSYNDSIQVIPVLPEGTRLVALAPDEVEPIWVYVNLTVVAPERNLVVDPTALNFTISEGDLATGDLTLDVSEATGAAIAYTATTGGIYLALSGDIDATTPGTALVNLTAAAFDLAPGMYVDTITVTAEADNSPVTVHVNIEVTPCPVLQPAQLVLTDTIFAGETAEMTAELNITSSGPGELDWVAGLTEAFTMSAESGTTPSTVQVSFARMYSEAGSFQEISYVESPATDVNTCTSQIELIANVVVFRPPSADTVIVVNTPAVPGMKVELPILFTNSCPLTGLYHHLMWDATNMHLDSVSFDGSAVEYVTDKQAAINFDRDRLVLSANVGSQGNVAPGSLQTLANLYFSLSCEIADGEYPISLVDPDTAHYFLRDCGTGEEMEFPEFIPGNIVVGSASNFVCGYVVEPDGDNYVEVPGATVELWADFPIDGPIMTTSSSAIGSFAFDSIMVIPFDLYAYKAGYYPGKVEDINFGEKGVMIVLEPLPDLVETSQWVDYYCPDANNLFLGGLVPTGAVVEAWVVDVLVGQKVVETPGQYGFMPVYRANDEFGDPGAVAGQTISFTINGLPATADGDVVYPAEYAQVPVCLEVRGTLEKNCTLFEGWNLVSWNVNTDVDDILTVLYPIMDYVDVVLGFEQGALTFDPDLQAFSTLWMVDHLSGYWIKIKDIDQIDLTLMGLPVPTATPIPVAAGWNLVSYLPEFDMTPEEALVSLGGDLLWTYGFDTDGMKVYQPGAGSFNTLDVMNTCNGYWVKMSTGGVLVYPDAPGEEPVAPLGISPLAAKNTNGVVASTNWIDLYSRKLTLDGETVAAGAIVTAHAVDNDQLLGRFEMAVDGQFGFMPVYADGAGETTLSMRPGDEFYLQIDGVATAETFEWTATGARVELAALTGANGIEVPTTYGLSQNYPNPFNPSTNIGFAMPVAGMAKIEVFNILGERIATPLNGAVDAGLHTVVWDGRNDSGEPVASGVYFYRFSADNYTEAKKMMLLK